MAGTLHKMGYVLGGYWEAGKAIRRQYDPGAIRDAQSTKLQRLIRHSFDNVKYYREVLERAGIMPDRIKSVDDLRRLPILTRHELRDQFWDFLPRNLPACRVSRTSGSTGIPICIFADWHSRRLNSAATIRFFRAIGVPLVGRPILTLLKTQKEQYKAPHWVVAQGLHKKYYVNPYITSQENRDYGRILVAKLRRPVLTGIASALRAFVSGIRDGLFPTFEPSVIITGGEMLLPQVRELIESTFGMKVMDIYACNEARNIAWQCREARGYHINADNVIVEIVGNDEPVAAGETGEVVLTDLNRYVMPIIRYKNGDLARLTQAPCSCGCRLPMLAEIVGRTGENVRLPDGRVVLWNHLKGQMTHPHIRQFQLVQEGNGGFVVNYVPEQGSDTEELENLLLRRFRNMIGESIGIRIERREKIEPAPSGKSKLVISHYTPEPSHARV